MNREFIYGIMYIESKLNHRYFTVPVIPVKNAVRESSDPSVQLQQFVYGSHYNFTSQVLLIQ